MSQQTLLAENIISNANNVTFPAKPAASQEAKVRPRDCRRGGGGGWEFIILIILYPSSPPPPPSSSF